MDYFARVEEWFDYLVRHGRKQTTITGYLAPNTSRLEALAEEASEF